MTSSGREGTQGEGCSGVEGGLWGVKFRTAFKGPMGTQQGDAQNAAGYVHQQKPPKLLAYLHTDVLNRRRTGKDEVHMDTFILTATQGAK